MAGADVGGPEKQDTGKKGLRRPKRRLGIRIDMTPMVDIAFLLLIFYMVTTVFAMPQAMEVNLPPASDEDVEIAESKLLTLRVDDENRFYWNMGKDLPIPMKTDSLRTLLVAKNKEIPKLNTLIIIHKDAKYKTMVDILDEIDLIERSFNTATAKELDVTLKEFNDSKHDRYQEFQKKKFSYRYAMKPWEDSDSRRIDKVLSQMGGE
jgi:biopolymer transport protein ExbD